MIDFHTHILPRIDDGAASEDISLEMLKNAYASGTDVVVLSSHFYPREAESIKSFLDRRNRRYKSLKEFCIGHEIPELRLAAEVNLHTNISDFPDLHELCIEGTDYMLVEMPMSKWEDWMYECIYNLTVKGIKPVIAHIDRYTDKQIDEILEIAPVVQVNADAFCDFFKKRKMIKMYEKGKIHVIGSDAHGLDSRNYDNFVKASNKLPSEMLEYFYSNSIKILNNKKL